MAKYYFRLVLLVATIIGFFALVGSLLPRSYSFTSEIEVAASPEQIFPQINSLPNWQNWSRQWNPTEIEGLEISYNNVKSGAGAAQSWTDIRGKGKLWITVSEADEAIQYEMEFAGFPKMSSSIELTVAADDKTTVRWTSDGKLPGGPFYGYFGSFFSGQMKSQYGMSLEKLKSLVESSQAKPNDVDRSDGEILAD
ncbi:MAG: hypothetical protein ACI87E_000628 [Mariniblastus sp.]|jgi:hypothetical protein